MNDDNKFFSLMAIIIGLFFVAAIYGGYQSNRRTREIEIIVTRKYSYSDKRTGIDTVSGYTYTFNKEDAEPFHPGGIYWIKIKAGKVLDFRKIGDLNVIPLGES